MPIKVLSQELINKIAAGEVVERPASVVKELVENSLDAKAQNITIEVENGGINLIKIIDDGVGMNRRDAELSIVQHATSKITGDEDLYQIMSLGFRGEALASISSISEFTLLTKREKDEAGTEVKVVDGEVSIGDAGAADGTSVEVANLFFNVPARQKYLKTAVTEFNHVVDLFLNYCLAYPGIAWKLVHNQKVVYQFPATKLQLRILDCLGETISGNLIPIDQRMNGVHVTGFVGRPQIARNNRKLSYLFINRRPVNEFIVSKQVKQAFGTLISRELYPVYILNLDVEPDKVDVNVHPRKMEVRFSEPQIIYRTVYQAIANTLDENELQKQVNVQDMKKFVPIKQLLSNKQEKMPIKTFSKPRTVSSFQQAAQNFSQHVEKQTVEAPKVELKVDDYEVEPTVAKSYSGIVDDDHYIPEYRVLGQIEDSYIIVESENGLKIYDQHASSERIQYEKIKNEWKIGRLASQKMLIPENVQLSPGESHVLNGNKELFMKLGFDIEDFGSNTFAVSAVPQILKKKDIKNLITNLVGEISENINIDEQIAEPVDNILKMMSCRSAIMFGDTLTNEGMEALINDLEKLDNQYTCVHGRPCVLEFKFSELAKMFKRT
jgi:DNA mismatch repair protein MutL